MLIAHQLTNPLVLFSLHPRLARDKSMLKTISTNTKTRIVGLNCEILFEVLDSSDIIKEGFRQRI